MLALVRAGVIDGLSIGFRTKAARVDPKTRVRKVAAVDLWEISIVTFPLLAGARIANVARPLGAKGGIRFSGPPYALPPRTPAAKISSARNRAETEWRALFGKTPQHDGPAPSPLVGEGWGGGA